MIPIKIEFKAPVKLGKKNLEMVELEGVHI